MTNAAAPPIHPADRLLAAMEAKGAPVCVGLDPVIEKLPRALLAAASEQHGANRTHSARILQYCTDLLESIAPHVGCVKVQMACFEKYAGEGFNAAALTIAHARHLGLEVILDAKRGDIGVTAEHYAAAAFNPDPVNGQSAPADWLTINSYLGEDGITPFLKHAGHGAFALVRTSNPGGDAIQSLPLKNGRTVSEAVGDLIAQIGSKHVGRKGYSSLGAVVGATKREDARQLRKIMPHQIFLVPGYGAQGGGVDDVLPCFNADGTGAIVTASRSIIYAFNPDDRKWTDSVAHAAATFAEEIGQAVGMR